jgi:Flp pilus assembly protein TadG
MIPRTRRQTSQRGHAMLELAVSAGVMVSCLAGVFQFGYTFYVYDQLVSAVGNGARYAAQRTFRAASPQDIERGDKAIRNLVVYGDAQPSADATPVVHNLKPEQVEVRWTRGGNGVPVAVDVTVHHYTVDAAFRSFTFDGRPSVEFPYVGRYAPAEREP